MLRKTSFLVLIISVFTIQVDAQAFQWAKQFAAMYSVGTDIVTDHNRNIISAGWFRDSVDLDPGINTHWVHESTNSSNYNSYLSKLDANGTFVWGYSYTSYDTNSYTRIYSVDVDGQNNIVVIGQYRDSIDLDFGAGIFMLYDHGVNSTFWTNLFIAKYDPNGNFIWGKGLHSTSGGNHGLWGHGLKVDANDEIIISGQFHDTVDFDPGPGTYNLVATSFLTNPSYGNKFLLKLTANGNFIWVRDWKEIGNWNNSSSWWGSNELDVDGNNNIYFPIVYTDSLDIDPALPVNMIYSNGLRDVTLLKVSPTGNLVWHKEIGGPNNDYCHSLATDPTGNIIYEVTTASIGSIDFDPGPSIFMLNWTSNWGKAILKLDNNGNFIWALKNLDHSWGGGWYGDGLATDTAGSIYITTRINSTWSNNVFDLNPGPNAYLVSSNGSWDVAFQNLDGNGQFIWGGVIGGSNVDWCSDICTDNARGVYLTGHFMDKADFDPTPDTSYMTATPSLHDAYIVKLNNCNVTKSVVYQACDSVWYNNQYYYKDTIMQAHYPAWNGCDSAHTIVINVKMPSHDTIHVDTCNSYFWNGNTYINTGFYTHNFGLTTGCDSIVTLDLTIRYKSTETLHLDLCDSMTINGVTYNSPGFYTQVLTNVAGCDSILSINLAAAPVDTSITRGGSTLTSNAVGATYQWIDCSTMLPIPNETNVFFNAGESGNYACVITQNGCTDTSFCYNMIVFPSSVGESRIRSHLYPNPSKGNYHIKFDRNYQNVQLELRSISGQLIWRRNYNELEETDFSINQAAGVYMLYIQQGEHRQVEKLVKW